MAPKPKFPLKNTPICFANAEDFASTGECMLETGCTGVKDTKFEGLTEKFFKELLTKREEVMEARQKFKDFDITAMRAKFPDWQPKEDFNDIRAQFQSMDLNLDGVVDFLELCIVLDELGDRSPVRVRKKYFSEIDEDGSGAIDFVEFVSLLYNIDKKRQAALAEDKNKGKGKKKVSRMDNLSVLCKEGCQNTQKVRKLSVAQQINNGLF